MTSFFLEGMPPISLEDFEFASQETEEIVMILQFSLWSFGVQTDWSRRLFMILYSPSPTNNLKFREFLRPIFIAISGKPVSPPLFDSMTILGSDICKARLKHSIELLGGISKSR